MTLCFLKENHIKCINKDAFDLYPVCKKTFYFQRHYIPTKKEYYDISITHADMDRDLFILGAVLYINTYNRSNLFLVWADRVKDVHDRYAIMVREVKFGAKILPVYIKVFKISTSIEKKCKRVCN